MTKQAKAIRNPFRFSRAGMTTIASFVAAPAIADDNFKAVSPPRRNKVSPWLCFYDQAAHFVAE